MRIFIVITFLDRLDRLFYTENIYLILNHKHFK